MGVKSVHVSTSGKLAELQKKKKRKKKRAEEHESHVRKRNTDMSAVAHHVVNTGHCVHWKARVSMTETNTRRRKVREALVINRLGPDKVMNLDRGTELSSLWLDLVGK